MHVGQCSGYYTRWDENRIDGGVVAARSRAILSGYYTRWDANQIDGGVIAARSRAIHSGYYTRWDANQIDGSVVAVRSRAIYKWMSDRIKHPTIFPATSCTTLSPRSVPPLLLACVRTMSNELDDGGVKKREWLPYLQR